MTLRKTVLIAFFLMSQVALAAPSKPATLETPILLISGHFKDAESEHGLGVYLNNTLSATDTVFIERGIAVSAGLKKLSYEEFEPLESKRERALRIGIPSFLEGFTGAGLWRRSEIPRSRTYRDTLDFMVTLLANDQATTKRIVIIMTRASATNLTFKNILQNFRSVSEFEIKSSSKVEFCQTFLNFIGKR